MRARCDSDSLYRFHHHLVRDTVYGGLLKRARATLHVDFVRWADQVNARARPRRSSSRRSSAITSSRRTTTSRELGPLDEKGRDDRRRCGAAPRVGGPPRVRARRRATPPATCCAAPSRCFPKDADQRLALLPELGEVLLELGQFAESRTRRRGGARRPRRSRTTAASKRRRGWPACWCACTAAKRAAGATARSKSRPPSSRCSSSRRRMPSSPRRGAWSRMVQQIAGQLGKAGETIAKVIDHARLAGDERLIARSALGMTLNAVYGPTPVPQAIAQTRGAHRRRPRRSSGAEPDHLQDRAAARDESATTRRREPTRRSARSVLRDLGPGRARRAVVARPRRRRAARRRSRGGRARAASGMRDAGRHRRDLLPLDDGGHARACGPGAGPRRGGAGLDGNGREVGGR